MNFLEAVARRFAGRGPLDRVCFVFPSRRSGTFFKRYLGIAAGRPVFVPGVMTIDELFSRIAGMAETPQKVRLLDVLYKEYIRLAPGSDDTGPESFDQFLYWGDILLSDFDDLDKYLVDVRRLLVNLHDLKALSSDYDFLTDDQTAAIAAFCNSFFTHAPGRDGGAGAPDGVPAGNRQQFARIWDILYPLYCAFRERLAEKDMAYAGMIYRNVAESLPASGTLLPEYDEIVFVGLNALNACEKRLLDHLRKEGRADFYWDYAGPMVTDPANLAGRFMRDNVRRFPPKEPFSCPARDPSAQHFEVIRVPSAVGQTRKAMQILSQLEREGHLSRAEETAVVLPDEKLLFPMLGAIPESIGHVNVTMGYALSASSGATLFQLLERLQAGRRERGGETTFYHRDVTDLLEHPYIAAAADPEAVAQVKKWIREENRIHVPLSGLWSREGIFRTVFQPVGRTGAIPAWLKEIIETLQAYQNPLEREFLSYYHKAVVELEEVGLDLDALEAATWFRLLSGSIALVKIPFEGEPLSGLQLMGPLETRALDFDNVILLSVGEGSFPSRSVSASFIPYNLRRGFGLPTYEMQDAMWAYYFYRFICRPARVYLIYDSRTEGMQSGEESRYVKQLRYLYEVPLVEKVATYSLSASAVEETLPFVEKDDAVMAALTQRYLVDGKPFSATALNAYLECPLRFYYAHVKGIKEADEVVESLDAGLFGSIFHRVMERLYAPFLGACLEKDALEALRRDKRRIETLIGEAFAEKHVSDLVGENLILRDLVGHFVRRILSVDAAFAASGKSLHLLDTEADTSWTLPLSDGRKVRLFGIIDRLDSLEPGVVRVVDYKSGSVKGLDDCGDVDRLFDTTLVLRRPSVAFQLYFYALMKTRLQKDSSVRFTPCTYSLRSIFSDALPASHEISPEKLDQFQTRLAALVEEILSPGKPFSASSSEDVCKYCNFKRLCNRQ